MGLGCQGWKLGAGSCCWELGAGHCGRRVVLDLTRASEGHE